MHYSVETSDAACPAVAERYMQDSMRVRCRQTSSSGLNRRIFVLETIRCVLREPFGEGVAMGASAAALAVVVDQ